MSRFIVRVESDTGDIRVLKVTGNQGSPYERLLCAPMHSGSMAFAIEWCQIHCAADLATTIGAGLSFACPHCGDWLPTAAGYAASPHANNSHTCSCEKTHTIRPDSKDGNKT